ncbi:MAG: SH3 domain-containing protein [Rhodobacteraceae bacterium]|nr:SH3 domain-containing protein [Paracoccaceae bacterium]
MRNKGGQSRFSGGLAMLMCFVLAAATIHAAVAAEAWRVMDGLNLNARSGPGTGYGIVETLPSGTVVEELDRDGNWSRVRTPAGNVVFVHNGYLVEPEEAHGWQAILQHGRAGRSIRFSPDGHTFAALPETEFGNRIWLWDAASGRVLRSFLGQSNIFSFAYSPDSRTIAATHRFGIQIWDVETGRTLRVLDNVHTEGRHASNITFSPDGRLIATGDDHIAEFWEVATGKLLHERDVRDYASVRVVEYSPDGRLVAAAASDHIRIWDAVTGKMLRELDEGISDHRNSLLRFYPLADPSGLAIAAGSPDGGVRLWDTSMGRELNAPDVVENRSGKGEISNLAFSPDVRIVATGSIDGTVRLWEMATGLEASVLEGHVGPITNITFSRDGRFIATGAEADGTVRLWNVATGRQLQVLESHAAGTSDIAFSPDGDTVVTISGDGTGRIWEVGTGREQIFSPSLADSAKVLALNPDGRILAAGYGGRIRLWNVVDGHLRQVLEEVHPDSVDSVAFSPDGRTIASRSRSGPVRLWDAERGRELRTLDDGRKENFGSVAFGRDGHILVSGLASPGGRMWDVTRDYEPIPEEDWPESWRTFFPNVILHSTRRYLN